MVKNKKIKASPDGINCALLCHIIYSSCVKLMGLVSVYEKAGSRGQQI